MGVSAGPARGGDEAVERVIGEPPNQGITGGDQCSRRRVGDRACRRIAPISPTGRAVHRLYDVAHVVVGVGDVLSRASDRLEGARPMGSRRALAPPAQAQRPGVVVLPRHNFVAESDEGAVPRGVIGDSLDDGGAVGPDLPQRTRAVESRAQLGPPTLDILRKPDPGDPAQGVVYGSVS